jgi:hypothetical protein
MKQTFPCESDVHECNAMHQISEEKYMFHFSDINTKKRLHLQDGNSQLNSTNMIYILMGIFELFIGQ